MMLRTRIVLVVVAMILLLSTGLLTASYLSQNEVEQRYKENSLRAKTVLWKKIATSQQDRMRAELPALTRNRDASKALRNENWDELSESVSSTYNRLSTGDSRVIDKLQVTDKRGAVVFSKPDDFRGQTKKKLISEALETIETRSGIVIDDDGRLAVLVATPLFYRGKPIGAGVLVRNLQTAIEDFKQNDGSDLLVLGLKGDVQYSTNKSLQNIVMNGHLPESEHSLTELREGDKGFLLTKVPIKNSAGRRIGHLVSVIDNTVSMNERRNLSFYSFGAVILVITFTIVVLFLYVRHSLNPLQHVVAVMKSVADGDLSVKIEPSGKDEVGQLLRTTESMVRRLDSLISQISSYTTQLATSSEEVSTITAQTQLGVDRQMSGTEQMATALSEMSSTVQEVARNAATAAESAKMADDESSKGGVVVEQTIEVIHALTTEVANATNVIERLEKDSEGIGAILSVIRSIAEQTNLLALNAAIEAARAGEQGRGFAVVADEVRTLASRTQQATEEIQEMIQRLQNGAHEAVRAMAFGREKAKASEEQVALASDALSRITRAVSSISDMNIQIASATEEQNAVAEEINRNVTTISEVSHETASGATQTAHASEELSKLAVQLHELMKQFKV